MALHQESRPMIGFSGTNGKTSAILMTNFILEQCGLKPASLSTWLGPKKFQQFREKAKDSDCLLVEVPYDALRLKQITGNIFQGGTLTNISLDHLSFCRTPEQYTAAKITFINELPGNAKIIINADDPMALAAVPEKNGDFLIYATEYPRARVFADNFRCRRSYSSIRLTVNEELYGFAGKPAAPGSAPVLLRPAGRHNVANALLAATVSLLFVPDLQAVARALCLFPGIRRNMEFFSVNQQPVIDDAGKNPAAIRAVLSTAESYGCQRILMLHGIYGGAGKTLNMCNARELAAWLKRNPANMLFVTRSMHHCKSRHQVRLSEEKAFLEELKTSGVEFAYYPDLPDALDSLLAHAAKGDLLLLLGGPVLNRARELISGSTGKYESYLPEPLPISPRTNAAIPHNPS